MKKLNIILVSILLLTSCTGKQAISTSTSPVSPDGTITSPATSAPLITPTASPEPVDYSTYSESKDAAVAYLISRLNDGTDSVYVYKDFSDSANHFTQKAKIDDGNSDFVYDMNENWQEDPYSGDSAIECRVKTSGNSWGGWLFVNGYLPKGETVPHLSFGEISGTGLDLTGVGRDRDVRDGRVLRLAGTV